MMFHLAEGTLRQNFKIRRRAYTPKLEKNRRPELGARPDLGIPPLRHFSREFPVQKYFF
jgi:hypothetical protein